MLISFEGLPGAGKSTQTVDTEPLATTLIDLFASSGDPYRRHGDAITETLLAAAIRTDILTTRIDPALEDHPDTVVIEDRGIHTMQSYALASLRRDHRANLDLAITWAHTLTTLTGQRPGHALWLRLPVEEALRRVSHRDQRAP
ncbi:MAG: hypothetical protein JO115_16310 [Pseudonocardiales bacterium]|nr:hypothetical protein [Pseudonocardiales bacterium]